MAEAALGLQGFDQLLERQVLMGLGASDASLNLLEQVSEGRAQVEFGLEYLGVDEKPIRPSVSIRLRLAVGMPTRMSFCPL